MIKQTVVCDRCGAEIADLDRYQTQLSFDTGRSRPDVAGGPSEEITEEIDVCHRCAVVTAQQALNHLEPSIQLQLRQRIQEIRRHG